MNQCWPHWAQVPIHLNIERSNKAKIKCLHLYRTCCHHFVQFGTHSSLSIPWKCDYKIFTFICVAPIHPRCIYSIALRPVNWLLFFSQGVFTFKNGRIFDGIFVDDRMAEYPQFTMDGTNTPDMSGIRTRTPDPAGPGTSTKIIILWIVLSIIMWKCFEFSFSFFFPTIIANVLVCKGINFPSCYF